jgi:hypothetical protein
VADLVQGEAALGDHLLEGHAALRVLPEVVTRNSDRAAVLPGHAFIVVHGSPLPLQNSRNLTNFSGFFFTTLVSS